MAAGPLIVDVRGRLSCESPPEEDGGTARMVDRSYDEVVSSGSTSRPFSHSLDSGGGDDGGVLPCENRTDEGEKEELISVSVSERFVDVDCLWAFLRERMGGGVRVPLASNLAMVDATWLPFETPTPGLSNP